MDYAKLLKENMKRGFHIDTCGFIPASGGWECDICQEIVNNEPAKMEVMINDEIIRFLFDNMDSVIEEVSIKGMLKFFEQEAERSRKLIIDIKLKDRHDNI